MILSRRYVLGGGLALACLPRHASAAQPLTPADWLSGWLAAFNDPGGATYPDFVRRNIPNLAPYLEEDLGVREASGGLVLLRSEQTAPREITAWVRDRNWDRFSKVVLSIGDNTIDDLSFTGAPAPPSFAVRRMGEAEALRALRRKLRAEAAAGRFSGSVLVAKGDQLLLREAYGAQDAGNMRAVIPATRFCIGSAGKMFTAVGVLQLVQAGRLSLADTIAMRLPNYPDTPLARSVTVRHLLTHTGGTGDFFGPDYDMHESALRTPSDFVRLFGRRDPLFPPGSRWGYSNFGFILLGAILEQVSGQSWDAYLQQNVFSPAGMTATSAVASPEETAEPLNGAAQTGLKPLPYYVGLPAGGGYSTVDDLHRFALALQQDTLLDPTHRRILTTPVIPAGSARWSLGLRIAMRNGEPCFGHGGSAPGVNADFAVYPRAGYAIITLCNRGHPHALNVAEFVGTRLPIA
ncbi:beta-lactamase family protein [Sphingomonas sp. MMSM20]|uniref:serine hydrolase domain-containing protein n=1 Tax=Sphingomonas lycopersici TaxID=2951807 RepID=UPI002237F04B|nr:serine hydrolase domain-containing protein [Sphingomonas lycopersici]MCW6531031.1 beta-lactamase family protein [Sphingomonas lycopersici]